jgi:hypothetical protein
LGWAACPSALQIRREFEPSRNDDRRGETKPLDLGAISIGVVAGNHDFPVSLAVFVAVPSRSPFLGHRGGTPAILPVSMLVMHVATAITVLA